MMIAPYCQKQLGLSASCCWLWNAPGPVFLLCVAVVQMLHLASCSGTLHPYSHAWLDGQQHWSQLACHNFPCHWCSQPGLPVETIWSCVTLFLWYPLQFLLWFPYLLNKKWHAYTCVESYRPFHCLWYSSCQGLLPVVLQVLHDLLWH